MARIASSARGVDRQGCRLRYPDWAGIGPSRPCRHRRAPDRTGLTSDFAGDRGDTTRPPNVRSVSSEGQFSASAVPGAVTPGRIDVEIAPAEARYPRGGTGSSVDPEHSFVHSENTMNLIVRAVDVGSGNTKFVTGTADSEIRCAKLSRRWPTRPATDNHSGPAAMGPRRCSSRSGRSS